MLVVVHEARIAYTSAATLHRNVLVRVLVPSSTISHVSRKYYSKGQASSNTNWRRLKAALRGKKHKDEKRW